MQQQQQPSAAAAAAAGYQLIDYRQLQGLGGGGGGGGSGGPGGVAGAAGLPAAISLEQYAAAAGLSVGGVPRPRIVNLRHHPYQRN